MGLGEGRAVATEPTDPHFTLQCCPGILAPVGYGAGNKLNSCSPWDEKATDKRHIT